jgi:HSP20 family protein
MALVRWEPFREIAALQNDMSRLMSSVFGAANGEQTRTWVPALDVWDTDKEVVYAFDLPGIPQDKISIEFEDNSLTVSGERERTQEFKDDRAYRFERRFGTFSRSIPLPQGVEEKDIHADYRDGVLEVKVTKPEAPQPRQIQIGKGSHATVEGKSKEA